MPENLHQASADPPEHFEPVPSYADLAELYGPVPADEPRPTRSQRRAGTTQRRLSAGKKAIALRESVVPAPAPLDEGNYPATKQQLGELARLRRILPSEPVGGPITTIRTASKEINRLHRILNPVETRTIVLPPAGRPRTRQQIRAAKQKARKGIQK